MKIEQLEGRALLAGDFVSAFNFAPWTAGEQADSAVAADASGNYFLVGSFKGTTIDLDPSGGTSNLTASAGGDVYVARYSAAGALLWARQVTSTGSGAGQFVRAADVTTDGAGAVYVTGHFEGPADFNPGAGANTLTSAAGRQEQFALKLDSAGTYVWARQIASATNDAYAGGIAVDGSGNVFVAGSGGTDPGGANHGDVMVTKLDSTGAIDWTRTSAIVGTGIDATVKPWEQPDVVVDSAGNVIVAGAFSGKPIFGDGEANETRLIAPGSTTDTFIWKLATGGNTLWARSQGGTGWDAAYGLAVDAANNIYTAGTFGGSADFDPRKGFAQTLTGTFETAYVSRLTPAGDLAWVRQMGRRVGGEGRSFADAVAVDGSVYVGGKIVGKVDLDPDPATAFVVNGKGADRTTTANFLTKLDSTGDFVYTTSFGGRQHQFPADNNRMSIAVSPTNGHVFATDTFNGTRDFDPSPLASTTRTATREDVFLLELTA